MGPSGSNRASGPDEGDGSRRGRVISVPARRAAEAAALADGAVEELGPDEWEAMAAELRQVIEAVGLLTVRVGLALRDTVSGSSGAS